MFSCPSRARASCACSRAFRPRGAPAHPFYVRGAAAGTGANLLANCGWNDHIAASDEDTWWPLRGTWFCDIILRSFCMVSVAMAAANAIRCSACEVAMAMARTRITMHRKDSRMGTWCSGITSASHAEGPGFNPQCVQFVLLAGLGCRGACCSAPLWALCRLPPPGGGCKSAAAS